MSDNPRIDELKRRVQQDPASIAFAALADEVPGAPACSTTRSRPVARDCSVTPLMCRRGSRLGARWLRWGNSTKRGNTSSRCCAAHPRTSPPSVRSPTSTAVTGSRSSPSRPRLQRKPRPSPRRRQRRMCKPHPRFPLYPSRLSSRPEDQRMRYLLLPGAPAPVPLKPVAVHADSHPSITLVTRASEPDVEELEIAGVATMADTHVPVIHRARTAPRRDRARQKFPRRLTPARAV